MNLLKFNQSFSHVPARWSWLSIAMAVSLSVLTLSLAVSNDNLPLDLTNPLSIYRVQAQVSGLVAGWALDEGTGTTASDISGNNNTGTLANGPTWTTGKYGNALSFDGANDYVNVPDAASLDLTSWTISAWIYPTSLPSVTWKTILCKGGDCTNYYLQTYGTELEGGFESPAGNWRRFRTTGAALQLNTWYHVAFTFDDATNTGKVYINGGERFSKTETAAPVTTATPLRIGTDNWNENWSGLLDDLRIYNRALSQAEIQTEMNTPLGGVPPPSFDFSLANSGNISVTQGQSITNTITATLSSGSAQSISYSASGLPTGATASFSPASCSPTCTTTITLTTQASTPTGNSTITVTGTDGSLSRTTSFTLTVQAPSDTTPPVLSNGSPSGTLSAGTTQTTMQVTTNENATCKYGTTPNTSYASLPNTFSTTGGTTHSTTITGLTNGSSYNYYVRCQDAAGNPNTSDYTISFSIAAPVAFNFSLTNSGNISVTQGNTAINTITANLTTGTPASLSFSTAGLPTGATSSFSSVSCTPNCSTALTISTQSSTPTGNSTITVTAQGGGATQTTTFTLTVNVSSPDTTPPTVSITTPANNSTVSGNTIVTANASDPTVAGQTTSGVAGVTFFYDLVNQIADILTSPFTTLWNTSAIPNGIHTLIARVRDVAGLSTNSAPISVTVSNGPSPVGNVYYVATTGSDTNSGTQTQPWRTIQKAANMVNSGDTVLIRGGVYNEKITMTRSGQAGSPITFKSYPGETAVIDGTGIVLQSYFGILSLDATASYINISDIEIINSSWMGIYAARPVGIIVDNVNIHDNGFSGLTFNCLGVNVRSNSRVINSKSHHNYQAGLMVNNCPGGYFTFKDNEVYNNVGASNYDGIQINDTPYVAVLNNIVRDNCGPSGPPCGGDSIDAGGTNTLVSPSHHLIYEGNRVSGPQDVAVKMNNEPLYSIIRRNTLIGTGIVLYEGPSKIAVYHNTVVNPGGEAVQVWGNGDNVNGLNFEGLQIKNNFFVDSGGYTLNIANKAVPDTTSVVFDSNLYKFLAGNPSAINVNAPNNYNRTFTPNAAGLVAFNQALGQEPNGKVTTQTQTQLFTDPATQNFTLTSSSAAIDGGQALTTVISQTNATTITVGNSWYFQDGWGGLLTPDTIRVGTQDVSVVLVDYGTHAITVSQPITAPPGTAVSLPYSGSAPDAGADEYSTGSPPPASFDFSITNSGNISVGQGSSGISTITATLVNGTPASLNFSATGLPTGATASFSPVSCSPNCSSTLTINTSASIPLGNSTITITAQGGGTTKTTTFTLTISDTTAPTFTTSPATSSLTSSAVTITFTTSEPTTATLDYGVTSQYGSTAQNQASAQTSHAITLTNLQSDTLYNYRVRIKDNAGNETAFLNQTFRTLPPADTLAPSAITDLASTSVAPTSLILSWTSSGDDANQGQAASYDLRFSTSPLTDTSFSQATRLTGLPTPKPSGGSETYSAIGLSPATTYYLALKSTDDASLTSAISNIIQASTTAPPASGGGGGGGGGYIPDTTPPASVAGLQVQAASGEARLTWTNPTDPDFVRTTIVRKLGTTAPASLTDGTLVYEGTAASFTDTNLTNGQSYSYSLFTLDRAGNYSEAMSPSSGGVTPTAGTNTFNTSPTAILGGLITADRLGGTSLSGATVTLKTTTITLTATTDTAGHYRFENLLPGTYTLTIAKPSHRPYATSSFVLSAGDSKNQNYYLTMIKPTMATLDLALAKRLSGRILLQVQSKGEAWYVNPNTLKRYYLGRPSDAFRIMREQGLGITNTNLSKIPEPTQKTALSRTLTHVSGRILLQVESHGEAWYVNPVTLKRHYLGRPHDAFRIMREQGLGITDSDLEKIGFGG